jgi:hypothetical protein
MRTIPNRLTLGFVTSLAMFSCYGETTLGSNQEATGDNEQATSGRNDERNDDPVRIGPADAEELEGKAPAVREPAEQERPASPPLAAELSGSYILESATRIELTPGSVHLTLSETRASFTAGCGFDFHSDFAIENGTFIAPLNGSVLWPCDSSHHLRAHAFLSSEPAIEFDGQRITLTDGVATLVLVSTEAAESNLLLAPLLGVKWEIWEVEDADGTTKATQVAANVVFGEDGRVTVSTGCSAGRGTFRAAAASAKTVGDVGAATDGARVIFGEFVFSDEPCSGSKAADIQSIIKAVFSPTEARSTRLSWLNPDDSRPRGLHIKKGSKGVLATAVDLTESDELK